MGEFTEEHPEEESTLHFCPIISKCFIFIPNIGINFIYYLEVTAGNNLTLFEPEWLRKLHHNKNLEAEIKGWAVIRILSPMKMCFWTRFNINFANGRILNFMFKMGRGKLHLMLCSHFPMKLLQTLQEGLHSPKQQHPRLRRDPLTSSPQLYIYLITDKASSKTIFLKIKPHSSP